MDIYHKWKELLSDEAKRNEWIEFYKRRDPIFCAVFDFCKQKELNDKNAMMELAVIAILDAKIKTLSDGAKMAHYMTRPLPTKLVVGQQAYPEDTIDFGSVKEI